MMYTNKKLITKKGTKKKWPTSFVTKFWAIATPVVIIAFIIYMMMTLPNYQL